MMRELLRRALVAVLSSAIAPLEHRLSKLEKRVIRLEASHKQEKINQETELKDMHATIGEWAGIKGYSQHE